MKIVIRAPNWIGDSILALPAIESVAHNYPEAEIWIAARGWVKDLFSQQAGITGVLTLPDKLDHKTIPQTAAMLKQHRFDIALLLTNSFASALLFYWARIPERWGCGRDGRRILLSRSVDCFNPPGEPHQVYYYLNLTSRLGLEPTSPQLNLTLSPEEFAWGEKILAGYVSAPRQKIVILNPGGYYGSAKRWPPSYYADLAARLQERNNALIVIIGSAADAALAKEVSSRLPKDSADLTGKTDLRQLAGILAAADLCVTNDSGPMHIANALHVPVVAMFGPTLPAVTQPFQAPSACLHKEVVCWPCAYRDCPFDHRCMRQISVSEVFTSCQEFKSGKKKLFF